MTPEQKELLKNWRDKWPFNSDKYHEFAEYTNDLLKAKDAQAAEMVMHAEKVEEIIRKEAIEDAVKAESERCAEIVRNETVCQGNSLCIACGVIKSILETPKK